MADWWAETLGWVVEPTDEAFIRRMIKEGYATEDDTKTYKGALVWKEGAAIRHPDGPETGPRKRVLFQAVPEPKTVKNRVHLDLLVGPEAHDAEVERLVALGATVVGVHDGDEGRWTLLTDPEGNEFDVS